MMYVKGKLKYKVRPNVTIANYTITSLLYITKISVSVVVGWTSLLNILCLKEAYVKGARYMVPSIPKRRLMFFFCNSGLIPRVFISI